MLFTQKWFAILYSNGSHHHNSLQNIDVVCCLPKNWFAILYSDGSHHSSLQRETWFAFHPKKWFAILHSNGSYHDPL